MNNLIIHVPDIVWYFLAAIFFLTMALIASRIAASTVTSDGITVNRELYRRTSEMAKWMVTSTAYCLVLSFTSVWGMPGWLTVVVSVALVLLILHD